MRDQVAALRSLNPWPKAIRSSATLTATPPSSMSWRGAWWPTPPPAAAAANDGNSAPDVRSRQARQERRTKSANTIKKP